MTEVHVSQTAAGVRLDVRVVPRAARTVVGGCRAGRLLVRVTAPPVDSAANTALIDALAAAVGVPRRAVRITAGASSRNKTIEIAGARLGDVQTAVARLSAEIGPEAGA